MHELSLACTMVEQIEDLMQSHGVKKLDKVTVLIGALSGVDREAFEFAFPMAVEDSALEGAALLIEFQQVEVTCQKCGANTSPEPIFLRCQTCGSREVQVISGRDFILQSLEYSATTDNALLEAET